MYKRRATGTSDAPTTHDLPGNWDDVDWREVGGGKWDFECKLSKCKVGSFLLLEEVSTVNVYSLAVGKIASVDTAKGIISASMFGPVLGTGSTVKACVTAKWIQRTPALVEEVLCATVAYYFPALTKKNYLPPDAKSRVANMGLLDRLRGGTGMQASADSDDDDDVPLSKTKVSTSTSSSTISGSSSTSSSTSSTMKLRESYCESNSDEDSSVDSSDTDCYESSDEQN